VWLLFVANEVQPDRARHGARMAELEQLLQQERQLELAAEQRGAQLRGSARAMQQQCEALQRRLAGGHQGGTAAAGSESV
jgi:hypothetical protein